MAKKSPTYKQMIAEAKAAGGKTIAPNKGPITCIKHDFTMMEHEHADHPDYMCVVRAVYCGPKENDPGGYWIDGNMKKIPMSKTDAEIFRNESHALIYTDGNIAVTMYECCYCMWYLGRHMYKKQRMPSGMCEGGSLWTKREWRLTSKSVREIKKRAPKH